MATIIIDLDEFDIDEILDHVVNYMEDRPKKEVEDFMSRLSKRPVFINETSIEPDTVLDEIKIDFFRENIHLINIDDLENVLRLKK